MKRYDVQVEGRTRIGIGEEEIKPLFRDGRIGRETPSRISGTHDWRTIEDLLPLLKYEFSMPARVPATVPPILPTAPASPVAWIDHDDEGRRALTTSLKAGWICSGLGAAVAWVFFPAYFFYSVALVMAVVAMCTRQVSRGLILLLSTLVAMGTSALISVFLMGTLFVGALGAAAAKAERDGKEQRLRFERPKLDSIMLWIVPSPTFQRRLPNRRLNNGPREKSSTK